MDWKTLGNILTANLLGEVMCSLNLADMVDLSYPSTRAPSTLNRFCVPLMLTSSMEG